MHISHTVFATRKALQTEKISQIKKKKEDSIGKDLVWSSIKNFSLVNPSTRKKRKKGEKPGQKAIGGGITPGRRCQILERLYRTKSRGGSGGGGGKREVNRLTQCKHTPACGEGWTPSKMKLVARTGACGSTLQGEENGKGVARKGDLSEDSILRKNQQKKKRG